MGKTIRIFLFLIGAAVALMAVNWQIVKNENLRRTGAEVLLPLRPVDPRSLMQGDYMVLQYAILPDKAPDAGTVILAVDQNRMAKFQRLDDGAPLQPNEQRLRYKKSPQTGRVRFGIESFFFQEGDQDLYSAAKFAIVRISAEGDAFLTGVADDKGKPIQRLNRNGLELSPPS